MAREKTERSPRAAAALEARKAGRALERWAEEQHAVAVVRGLLAWCRWVSPKVEMLGRGRAAVVGEAACDFNGCSWDGKAVVVECKSTRDARLDFSQLEKPQREQLQATAAAGGAAILLVEFRAVEGSPRFAVPWQAIPWRSLRKGSRGSVGPLEIGAWLVKGDCYVDKFFDRVRGAA